MLETIITLLIVTAAAAWLIWRWLRPAGPGGCARGACSSCPFRPREGGVCASLQQDAFAPSGEGEPPPAPEPPAS